MPLVALIVALAAAASSAASPSANLGVYRGAGAPGEVRAFERWNGDRPVAYALDFLPIDEGWDAIARPDWFAERWEPSPYRVVYSVPLLPRDGSTLAQGAAGAYDGHFASMARSLVAHGQGDAILRLGWEFDGNWFPWAAGRDPEAFVAYWRRVVDAIRAVPGAHFSFDWTAAVDGGGIAPDRAYPGDDYVDVIGLDVYDQGWGDGFQDPDQRWRTLLDGRYGLRWHRAFAAAHGKPESFPEWGLADRPDGHGGGDDAAFVRRMHAWIAGGNVRYHCYFDFDAGDGRHRISDGAFPRAAAEFRRIF